MGEPSLPPMNRIDTERPTSAGVSDRRIGEILSQVCHLAASDVSRITQYQTEKRIPFGEAAIELGLARREDVVWALSKQYSYSFVAEGSGASFNDELVMARSPFSDEVECFRSLRTHLSFGLFAPGVTRRRPLAVVSPNIGDGKTFVLCNLAVAFSQLRSRTVIVDADLRSPRLHKIFGIDNTDGLTATLSGRSPAMSLRSFGDILPNLYILPAGAIPPNPTELLHSPEFDLLLSELSGKFDVVLVDTPAADHGSDARVIAEKCGSALVVVRKDQSRMKDAEAFLGQLRQGDCIVVGPLIND